MLLQDELQMLRWVFLSWAATLPQAFILIKYSRRDKDNEQKFARNGINTVGVYRDAIYTYQLSRKENLE
jgi:hypothetical protein